MRAAAQPLGDVAALRIQTPRPVWQRVRATRARTRGTLRRAASTTQTTISLTWERRYCAAGQRAPVRRRDRREASTHRAERALGTTDTQTAQGQSSARYIGMCARCWRASEAG